MKRVLAGVCVAVAFTAVAGAQNDQMMTKAMDHGAMEKVYSGCVARDRAGAYTLTHAMTADTETPMAHDGMASMSLALHAAAKDVDLRKHVGHTVTVTGTDGDRMNGVATFNVTSLKMTGTSCVSATAPGR